jgi:hypothetical protein
MSGPRRKSWSESRKGFRHQAILAAQSTGLSYREAKAVVEALITEMKIVLALEGELCLDWIPALLRVRCQVPERVWRFGRVVTVNRTPQYIVLPPPAE